MGHLGGRPVIDPNPRIGAVSRYAAGGEVACRRAFAARPARSRPDGGPPAPRSGHVLLGSAALPGEHSHVEACRCRDGPGLHEGDKSAGCAVVVQSVPAQRARIGYLFEAHILGIGVGKHAPARSLLQFGCRFVDEQPVAGELHGRWRKCDAGFLRPSAGRRWRRTASLRAEREEAEDGAETEGHFRSSPCRCRRGARATGCPSR